MVASRKNLTHGAVASHERVRGLDRHFRGRVHTRSILAHTREVAEDALHDHNSWLIEEGVDGGQILAVPLLETRNNTFVQRSESRRGCLLRRNIVEQRFVLGGRSERVVLRLTKLECPLAQRVCVLCEIPDVAPEHHLYLHLWGRRCPGG